jgi:hypothetical protein
MINARFLRIKKAFQPFLIRKKCSKDEQTTANVKKGLEKIVFYMSELADSGDF